MSDLPIVDDLRRLVEAGSGTEEQENMAAAADVIEALAAELETVKGERDYWKVEAEGERAKVEFRDRRAAEAKLTGGEAVKPRHIGTIAHIDHGKTALTAAVARFCALTHPAPTHNDGSGEAVASEWHRADNAGSILLYTLMQQGWRKGEPIMVNDVMVRIENANGSQTPIEPIARSILEALSHTSGEVTEAWQSMDTAPKEGTEFLAVEFCDGKATYARRYRWEEASNYWNSIGDCVCIRAEYQDKFLWTHLPALRGDAS